jgi:hypothetical protein
MNLFEEAVREGVIKSVAIKKIEDGFCMYSNMLDEVKSVYIERLIEVLEIEGLDLEDNTIDFENEIIRLEKEGNFLAKDYNRLNKLQNKFESFRSDHLEVINETNILH